MTKNETAEKLPEIQQTPPLKKFLFAKILDLMNEVGGYVQKDKLNKQQNYTYLSEAGILAKIQPAICKVGLLGIPKFRETKAEDKITLKGDTWKLVTVEVTLKVIDPDTCEYEEIIALGQGLDSGDKAIGKAQTQALKYAWWKLLQLGTGDDPEADPITDAQQFSNPQQAPAQTSQALELAVSLGEPPMGELLKMWQFAGWNAQDLPDYVLKRLNKPSLDSVTPSEYSSVINDLATYMQSIGLKVTVVPF